MGTVRIDQEYLAVTLPEGFEDIEHNELERLMDISYDCLWGVRDTGRHMMITVTWKDSSKLLTKLVNERGRAKQIDKNYARCRNGEAYRSDGIKERVVTGADAPASGFHFAYRVEDVDQEGEVWVFKRGIRCYTLVIYTRSEAAADNAAVLEDILASLTVQ